MSKAAELLGQHDINYLNVIMNLEEENKQLKKTIETLTKEGK